MNTTDLVFPSTDKLVCRWHVNRNVELEYEVSWSHALTDTHKLWKQVIKIVHDYIKYPEKQVGFSANRTRREHSSFQIGTSDMNLAGVAPTTHLLPGNSLSGEDNYTGSGDLEPFLPPHTGDLTG
ncbi:hypothetical protein JG687_00019648 [Phytophthora cactorum]|uniref:Uncharacterized protein n=1 Tax=Phytophthora cactorum TaxID=29920 RepID=A0A8T1TLJ7_9STRA|nr:hypothetical protein JG687_00019648 [Phytophthora cactorum]